MSSQGTIQNKYKNIKKDTSSLPSWASIFAAVENPLLTGGNILQNQTQEGTQINTEGLDQECFPLEEGKKTLIDKIYYNKHVEESDWRQQQSEEIWLVYSPAV